jgi:hypothetical protein
MTPSQLEGYFLNAHIRFLIEERDNQQQQQQQGQPDPTALALKNVLRSAEKSLDAARAALQTYLGGLDVPSSSVNGAAGSKTANGEGDDKVSSSNGVGRRTGPTSRELSGEMGGDTAVQL